MTQHTPRPSASGAMTGSATARADIVDRLRSRAWEHRSHREYRAEAADTIDALRARVAELERDAGRLDVLETTFHLDGNGECTYAAFVPYLGFAPNLRAAIDAASQPIALQQFADPVPGA